MRFRPLRNRKAFGDTDEGTALGTAITWIVACGIITIAIGIYAVCQKGSKTVADVNTGSIQQQNESITGR